MVSKKHNKKPTTLINEKGKRRSTSTRKQNGSKIERRAPDGSSPDLVIVESPTKARTIGHMLGAGYVVKASQGHVRDLPKGKLGVDIDQNFEPSYTVPRDKASVIKELKGLGTKARSIYLATDPDREGEAISWHLIKAASWDKSASKLHRVVFHEITSDAVQEAFTKPRKLNMDLVNAQQARRILDRLVGYQISPLLWRKVQRGLSAGRVQSVTLRIIVDRESEISSFVPNEYWTIDVLLTHSKKSKPYKLTARLHSIVGQRNKIVLPNEDSANDITKYLKDAIYRVAKVTTKKNEHQPAPPFTTSTMQQEAWKRLRFQANKTMRVAQQLYEGLSIGNQEPIGIITYMRTDSTQVSSHAIQEARNYVEGAFGKNYVPVAPRTFRRKSKGAQEAHEAIRPTSISRTPDDIKLHLTRDQLKLYTLIWSRMVASQMANSISSSTAVDIHATSDSKPLIYNFRASGSVVVFNGFRILYIPDRGDADDQEPETTLPAVKTGDLLTCSDPSKTQHFTQPPIRYTEAGLIKILEDQGIGRPSTYAPTISVLESRQYIFRDSGSLKPTELGFVVCKLLAEYFPNIMDPGFTATMEESLDNIAKGEQQWVPMLEHFYGPFSKSLSAATDSMPRVKVEEPTEETCELCESPMVIKTGRFGRFMACSNFPECRHTKPLQDKIGVSCPECGADLLRRRSRGKGRIFFGCSRFPNCNFVTNQKPISNPCPECSGLMVLTSRDGKIACTRCSWTDISTEYLESRNGLEKAPSK